MPLHLKTVTPALKEILYELMDCSLFKPFRLVGGTNLCLRFGYRLSSDIDLFTDAEYESIDLVDGADDLHKDGADGQNGRTAEEGALFLRFRQWNAAFPGPVARRDKTLLFYMSLTGKR